MTDPIHMDENLKEAIRLLRETGEWFGSAEDLESGRSGPIKVAAYIRGVCAGTGIAPSPLETKALALLDILSSSPTSTGEGGSRGQGEAVEVLVAHAEGRIRHLYTNGCPGNIEGPDARDPECRVCQALRVLRGES